MEKWKLDHPHLGALNAYVGWPEELRTIDADFPEAAPGSGDLAKRLRRSAREQNETSKRYETAKTSPSKIPSPPRDTKRKAWSEHARHTLNRNESWGRQSVLLERDGVPFGRFRSIGAIKVPLDDTPPEGSFTEKVTTKSKPHIEVQPDPFGRHVNDILLQDEGEVLTFDPPEDSPAAKRHAAMESSAWKRALYPLSGGLGKSSSALVGIFLGPIIVRIGTAIIAWILSFFPHINLPTIPWPHIHWPRISWPRVDLPTIPWPHIDLPPWAQWLLEHPKVWTPVLLAAFWGVMSARNRKKSQQKKAEWAAREASSRHASNRPLYEGETSHRRGSTALSASLRANGWPS